MELIYGLNPVKEALTSGRRKVYEIMISRERYDDILSMSRGIPVNSLPRNELEKLARTRGHQGIMARVSSYPYESLSDCTTLDVVILLDSVEDPQNLGAIIRTAYALAGAGIIIPEDRSASITPAVVKASAGATEHAMIARVKNLRMAAKELKKAGFWLVGMEAGGRDALDAVPQFDKLALVIGGEDTGVRPVMQKELDIMASIPMKSEFNSLNVAQSAAIALYELMIRR